MRVLCGTLDGSEIEGEVIGGDHCEGAYGEVDLAETFTVRTARARSSPFMAGWSMLSFWKRTERVM